MNARLVSCLLAVAWLLVACPLFAASPRAWLDRDRIATGETVTLNIESTDGAAPDYGPLQRDFDVSAHTSRQQFERSGGRATSRTLHGVALRPRRAGRLIVPPLAVGRGRTAPLVLTVAAGTTAPPARAGDDVFIESRADDADPYVQQSVGWVVRLYAAVPVVSGELEQPAPRGALMQRIGEDIQYTRDLGNRRYKVVERRYLLVPERSGPLEVPGAGFEGRGIAGFFDRLLGSGDDALRAGAPPRVLQVRPVPADAAQPWLPLQSLQLRHVAVPRTLGAGRAATLAIELSADGATAAQLPEVQLPPVDGLQVLAEPAQVDERFVDGRPRATVVRRFSLVPTRGGAVRLPAVRVPWWDVHAGRPRVAVLPALDWRVDPATGAAPTSPAMEAAAAPPPAGRAGHPPAQGANRYWILAALLFAALWLFTLVWGLQRRVASPATAPSGGGAAAAPSARPARDLARLLVAGDLGDVVTALQAMARPPVHTVDALRARLDDPAQVDALDAVEHARWGGGDARIARVRLQTAFAKGPRWKPAAPSREEPLPPLYPRA